MSKLTIFNKEVIPVYTTDEGEKVVLGRELHERLGIATDYKDWFPRMCKYGFEDRIDFSSFLSKSTGGRPSQEHLLRLDMAKHIAMIQRTEAGKAIRQKLIDLETNINELSPELQFMIKVEQTQKLQQAAIKAVEEKLETVADKVDNQMTIDHAQQRVLQNVVSKRAYERAVLIYPAEDVTKKVKLIYAAVYRDIKDRFGVPSYKDVKPKDLPSAIQYVEAWVERAELRSSI